MIIIFQEETNDVVLTEKNNNTDRSNVFDKTGGNEANRGIESRHKDLSRNI